MFSWELNDTLRALCGESFHRGDRREFAEIAEKFRATAPMDAEGASLQGNAIQSGIGTV
jgi:hypothetical protein